MKKKMYEEAYLALMFPFATMEGMGAMAFMTTAPIQLPSPRVCFGQSLRG